ncbi:hypothetical protein F0562_004742 [Nyssa sinensis]|uniref:Uncharacterized protein n=1 Tax=Nyssa sinensis TaxID=561372 RepID=A0A5J5BYP3_9ASTE|nr:hypothetical protein F0562_004742 [Nyssa sinensis]
MKINRDAKVVEATPPNAVSVLPTRLPNISIVHQKNTWPTLESLFAMIEEWFAFLTIANSSGNANTRHSSLGLQIARL